MAKNRFSSSLNLLIRLKADKVAFISALGFVLLATLAFAAPLIAPHNPYDIASPDLMNAELPPLWQVEEAELFTQERFLLGTDHQGRDILSTILYGMRTSLIIGLLAVSMQAILGILIGLSAGYIGGRLDALLMRIADIQLSFSTLMVAIVILAIVRASFGLAFYQQYAVLMLVLVIGLAEWPQYARVVRAGVLAEKEKEYVEAAKVVGVKPHSIMFVHILPNTLASVMVVSTVQVANAIISEATLSFLGLGMPPTRPSLGSLISSGFEYIFSGSWWITVIPGIFLVGLVLMINLLGDWLRDVLDPKLNRHKS